MPTLSQSPPRVWMPHWVVPWAVVIMLLGCCLGVPALIGAALPCLLSIGLAYESYGASRALFLIPLSMAFYWGFVLYYPGPGRRIGLLFVLGLSIAGLIMGIVAEMIEGLMLALFLYSIDHLFILAFIRTVRHAAKLLSPHEWTMKHLSSGKCPVCLYDLRALAAYRCPECGTDLSAWSNTATVRGVS